MTTYQPYRPLFVLLAALAAAGCDPQTLGDDGEPSLCALDVPGELAFTSESVAKGWSQSWHGIKPYRPSGELFDLAVDGADTPRLHFLDGNSTKLHHGTREDGFCSSDSKTMDPNVSCLPGSGVIVAGLDEQLHIACAGQAYENYPHFVRVAPTDVAGATSLWNSL